MANIYCGIPMHNNGLSAQTFHSLSVATSYRGHKLSFQVLGLSLLARNFNSLFLSAYNKGYDYFFLHHSDIGFTLADPTNGSWIDLMVERLEQLQAAALSVVSPIKSPAGHTSTALVMDKDNVYNLRRITVRELDKLPDPFITRNDVCKLFGVDKEKAGALLVNTAGLLMDLRKFDWTKWPGFEIRDRIYWNKNGYGVVRTVPEDWNFSQWMHENGYPYYATKEVRAHHMGGHEFTSFGGWGLDEDTQPRECTVEEWLNDTEKKPDERVAL